MKRTSSSPALVSYPSSDEGEQIASPPIKKRKLPALSSSLITPPPTDNPALHQGRIRTTPHVEGQFAAHIYVSLPIEPQSPLHNLLADVLRSAKDLVPTLREFSSTEDPEPQKDRELHISLSRPIYLRAHQREDLKRAVKATAKQSAPFTISFATFCSLTNDERTRTFLAMEIGAGHHELRSLSDTLTPVLQTIRQKEFYPNPRFHASIAWALLDPPPDRLSNPTTTTTTTHSTNTTPTPPAHFPTIHHFPPTLIPTLTTHHGPSLASPKVGSFDIDALHVKIGKEVRSWQLTGP